MPQKSFLVWHSFLCFSANFANSLIWNLFLIHKNQAALNNVLILCFRFPIGHFGVLFGFIQFAAGIAGLLQYPLFEWAGGYEGSFDHVSLLCCK